MGVPPLTGLYKSAEHCFCHSKGVTFLTIFVVSSTSYNWLSQKFLPVEKLLTLHKTNIQKCFAWEEMQIVKDTAQKRCHNIWQCTIASYFVLMVDVLATVKQRLVIADYINTTPCTVWQGNNHFNCTHTTDRSNLTYVFALTAHCNVQMLE